MEKMISKIEDTFKVRGLFENWQETMIWSCLQGMMGDIYTDNIEHPASAVAVLGDFCFLAGEPKKELVLFFFFKQKTAYQKLKRLVGTEE